jgi:hypothetical protein
MNENTSIILEKRIIMSIHKYSEIKHIPEVF